MRSREPWRLPAGQSRAVPFLQAAVLFAALCIFARSATLSQKAALQMPFTVTTPLVKMRLERSAERDKRENLKIPSAIDAQSASGGHLKSFTLSASRAAAR